MSPPSVPDRGQHLGRHMEDRNTTPPGGDGGAADAETDREHTVRRSLGTGRSAVDPASAPDADARPGRKRGPAVPPDGRAARLIDKDMRQGMWAGLAIVPTFLAIFAGFAIAAQVVGLPGWATFALTVSVYSAPAQFAMLEFAGHGPTAIAPMVFAGVMVNLRFILMSMTLSQLFPRLARGRLLLTAQLVTASSYLVTFFHSRREPHSNLHRYFLGVAVLAFPAAVAGTLLGLYFGTQMPSALAFGATLFLPIYFSLLLFAEVKARPEIAAVIAGLVLTPPAELLLPGWGMLIVAIGAGGFLAMVER
jgi:predicted branched-subunit amino acid permease